MRTQQRNQSRRDPIAMPPTKTPEEIQAAKDLLTELVKPRWRRLFARILVAAYAVEQEQNLYDLIDVVEHRNLQFGTVPEANRVREPSGTKTLMTLSRGEDFGWAKAHHHADPKTCLHVRADLKPRGAGTTFWVACAQCGKQWNREPGIAKQNVRAPALQILEGLNVIPAPNCPLPNCRKPMVLREGNNAIFWGCSDYPEPGERRSKDEGRCNFALSCYQQPPYQLMLFTDNKTIPELRDLLSSSGSGVQTQKFPMPTIASTLWTDAGATTAMINRRLWRECHLSDRVDYLPTKKEKATTRTVPPVETIVIDGDASRPASSAGPSQARAQDAWTLVEDMEVELDADERATIESFRSMLESGVSLPQATLKVSSQAQPWYRFTPAVHKAVDRIIQMMEDPEDSPDKDL